MGKLGPDIESQTILALSMIVDSREGFKDPIK